MSETITKKEKLKTKDVITVVLLTLINLVIFGFSSFLYATPITILLMPVMFGLLEGIVFFMIGAKVKKKGAILIYCIIHGIIGFFPPYVIMYIVAGIIAEVILSKMGYGNPKALSISYIIIQFCACLMSTIVPYTIMFEFMQQNSPADARNESMMQAAAMLQQWGWIVVPIVTLIVSVIGAIIGKQISKKHL